MMILLLAAAFCFNPDQTHIKASSKVERESIFLDLKKEIKEKREGSAQKEHESELKLGSKTRVLVDLNSQSEDSVTCHEAEGGKVKRREEDRKKAEEKAFRTTMMIPTETETRGTGTAEAGKETGSKNININRSEEEKFEGETKFMFESKAEVRATVQTDKEGKYHIKDSGIGNSWLIGTDVYDSSADYANGFVKGISGCPPVLEIPGILSDSEGHTKPVEIIGQLAFVNCGCYDSCTPKYGKTKILKVPRQVKVIKPYGLGGMSDLESFEIEAGSELQTIEDRGLDYIGFTTGETPSKRNGTLILPSTLSSVYDNGIYACNLFHTIIYCGSHSLTNTSYLEHVVSPKTVVKVTNRYPPGSQIFKRTPNRTIEAEAERMCKGFFTEPTTKPTPSPKSVFQRGSAPLLAATYHLLSLTSPLPPTDSLPSFSLRRWSPSFFFFFSFG